ncbi:MAG: ribose 5-phosphate isomerase B [Acidobacteriota bacterium]|nr:ribose 5-phosphate isomerase B [Acidobacteriota bacterium]
MKIAVASDHAGYDLKTGVLAYLAERGIEAIDLGCGPGEKVDYVDFGAKAAQKVAVGGCDRAILVCGTGMGMAIVANKFRGIRATPCCDAYTAEMSRAHNDSNCLALGGRTLSPDNARTIVRVWLDTPFEGGRHAGRTEKIRDIEDRNFKPRPEDK